MNNNKVIFELSNNEVTYFKIDFFSFYTPYYSLANIFGFEINTNNYTSSNNKIISPYIFDSDNNDELFFCFDEFNSNIIETHKLVLNKNISTNKILAKINTSLGNKNNNYIINEVFSINNMRNDNIREYSGTINLSNFNMKIIDCYNNIIENMNKIKFTLEIKMNLIKIKNNEELNNYINQINNLN